MTCDCVELERALPNFRAIADSIHDRSELAEALEQMYFEGYDGGFRDARRDEDSEHA